MRIEPTAVRPKRNCDARWLAWRMRYSKPASRMLSVPVTMAVLHSRVTKSMAVKTILPMRARAHIQMTGRQLSK